MLSTGGRPHGWRRLAADLKRGMALRHRRMFPGRQRSRTEGTICHVLPVTVHLQGTGAMSTIPRPHLSSLWTAVLFTLYFFVFLTSEVFLQDCLLALDRPEDLHIFFLGQMACLAAGYLSLSLCRRCAYGLLRSVAAAAMLFPALLFIALAFMGIPASLLLWAAACSYFLGGTGAFLHYSAALCLHRSAVTGRVAGGEHRPGRRHPVPDGHLPGQRANRHPAGPGLAGPGHAAGPDARSRDGG